MSTMIDIINRLQEEVNKLQKERDLYAEEDRRVTEIALQRKLRIEELEKENQELQKQNKEMRDDFIKVTEEAIIFAKSCSKIEEDYAKLCNMRDQVQAQKFCERCKQKFTQGHQVICFIMPFCGTDCRDEHLKELGLTPAEMWKKTGGKLK